MKRSKAGVVPTLRRNLLDRIAFALCTVVRPPDIAGRWAVVYPDGRTEGDINDLDPSGRILGIARDLIARGHSKTVELGGREIFVDTNVPQPRLIIVGAVHIGAALCEMATLAGFAVTVIDPRAALNNRERFPHADQLLVGWPEDELPKLHLDSNTYVAVLTHDEKFDDPSVLLALQSRVRYIGAIGSKKTQALRRERLRSAGISDDDIARLCGPIGLDIGADSPEEIAVAILAEMIAAKYQRTGTPLHLRTEPHIHA